MGADAGGEEDEHPAHTVTVDAFYLDLTEVTQEAYIACVDESVCAAPKIAYLEIGAPSDGRRIGFGG